jgi:RNA recognition motif-containing protein
MVKLFVGNLSYSVEEQELKALLERAGKVRDV